MKKQCEIYKECKEAYDKVNRKFQSGNGTEVERAVITKEEWELAKQFIVRKTMNNVL